MKTLPPLTDEERELAEKYHHLIDEFLRRKRLDPSEYYDVAVFGYLSAIQQECRSGDQYPEEKKNFIGLVEVCMRNAVYEEWAERKWSTKKANYMSVSIDAIRVPDTDSSLYEILEDPWVNIEESVAARDLVERLLAEAQPRERRVAEYICMGYTPYEAAEKLGLPPITVSRYLYTFRDRARAIAEERRDEYERKCEEQREKRFVYLESHKDEIREQHRAYREAHLEQIRERERAYHEKHRDEINARQRAKRAARTDEEREKEREKARAYREAHKEEIKARKQAYREAHRDEINARQRAKRASKKEQARLEAPTHEADIKRASYSPVSLKRLGMKPEGDTAIIAYPRDENKEVIIWMFLFAPTERSGRHERVAAPHR